jgi:hypothetical protein
MNRHGQSWDDRERKQLETFVRRRYPLDYLARLHGRTPLAILCAIERWHGVQLRQVYEHGPLSGRGSGSRREMLAEDIGWVELTPEEIRLVRLEKEVERLQFRVSQLWRQAGVFPSVETCAKAGQSYADYEGGRERGKAEVQKTVAPRVYWFCLPVRVQGQIS